MIDEDILNDLDDEFEDDLEDILDDASLSDLNTGSYDEDDFQKDDPDLNKLDEDIENQSESKKTNAFKKIVSKAGGKKFLIIAGSTVLIIIVLVAVLVFLLSGKDPDLSVSVPGGDEFKPSAALIEESEIIFEDIVELAPFERIHLKTSSTMGLVTLGLSLELTDHRYRRQIYQFEERIRQMVLTQVAEMTWLELRSPDGKIRLKYALLKRINALFPQATVRNIYFTYFIMQ